LCTLKQRADDAENGGAREHYPRNANITVQFNALHKNKGYAVMKCDYLLALPQFIYEVESDNLLRLISHVVNWISACRTHAVNIDGDSKVLKNQLMAARRFRPYPFSLSLRSCRIAHTP
jgi:hypothetical protein